MVVILGPVITEKSMKDASAGKFTFRVEKKADKNQIKKAVEGKFKVNVLDVATIIVKPKQKMSFQRHMVTTPSWKKAVVKVLKDQKIALFDIGGKK